VFPIKVRRVFILRIDHNQSGNATGESASVVGRTQGFRTQTVHFTMTFCRWRVNAWVSFRVGLGAASIVFANAALSLTLRFRTSCSRTSSAALFCNVAMTKSVRLTPTRDAARPIRSLIGVGTRASSRSVVGLAGRFAVDKGKVDLPKTLNPAVLMILSLLQSHFNVKTILMPDGWGTPVDIIGAPADIDFAIHAFNFLPETFFRCWNEFKRTA